VFQNFPKRFSKIHVRHIGSAILNFGNLTTGSHSTVSKPYVPIYMTIQWLEKFVPQS